MKKIIEDLLSVIFSGRTDSFKEVTEEDVYSEFAMTCATIDF